MWKYIMIIALTAGLTACETGAEKEGELVLDLKDLSKKDFCFSEESPASVEVSMILENGKSFKETGTFDSDTISKQLYSSIMVKEGNHSLTSVKLFDSNGDVLYYSLDTASFYKELSDNLLPKDISVQGSVVTDSVDMRPNTDINHPQFEKIGLGKFEDFTNDVERDFLDFDSLQIDILEDMLEVKMHLVNLPEELLFDHNALEMNRLNYKWRLYLDVDKNHAYSPGDLSIVIMRYKFNPTESSDPILNFTQKNVWSVTSEYHTTGALISGQYIEIKDNIISLKIPFRYSQGLYEINSTTPFFFSSYMDDGESVYIDLFPNAD